MMGKTNMVIVFCCLFIGFSLIQQGCSSYAQKEEPITISGAFALYPLMVKWVEEYQKITPHLRFDIQAGGTGKGITDVITMNADIAMISREIVFEELSRGIVVKTVAIDAVLPTVNANNPMLETIKKRGFKKIDFEKIYTRKENQTWGKILNINDNHTIHTYTRSDACGAAETWSGMFGLHQENLTGTGVFGDPALAEVVSKDIYAIGYNGTAYIFDPRTLQKRPGIEVIPLDMNDNGKVDTEENIYENYSTVVSAIENKKYHKGLTRNLSVATKGKLKPSIENFIRWMSAEGQKYNIPAGYGRVKLYQSENKT